MARADIPLTDRPDIYLQSSLEAIIVSSLANRVESIYTLATLAGKLGRVDYKL